MSQPWKDVFPRSSNAHVLLAYVADLELEVDRLRKQGQFLRHEVRGTLKRIDSLCDEPEISAFPEISRATGDLAAVMRDLQETPGYHPAHDQVVAIAVRPLVEQVFRAQQRMLGASQVVLQLEMEADHVEWFPARLRHILDNLISNSLRFRDSSKDKSWVKIGLRTTPAGYEFRVVDNGLGLPPNKPDQLFDLFYRAAPARAAGLGVGLAVVKLLVEQSGGKLTVDSGEGQGTTFILVLPPYELDDYLC